MPFKRVRAVQLQQDEENKLLIDAQLGLLFNTTGTKKLDVEGCPSLDLIYTTYEGIILTMNSEAQELELVKGLNVHEVNSLGPTLEFIHHTNHHHIPTKPHLYLHPPSFYSNPCASYNESPSGS